MVSSTSFASSENDRRPPRSKQSLSASQQALLELMQSINFGHIERLEVRDGQPVLDPPPRVVREVKFGSVNGETPQRGLNEFALKSQVVELFAYLARMTNGVVEVLEVKHGLPFLMRVADAA